MPTRAGSRSQRAARALSEPAIEDEDDGVRLIRGQNMPEARAALEKGIAGADANRLHQFARWLTDDGLRNGEPKLREAVVALIRAVQAQATREDTRKMTEESLKKLGV